MPADTQAWKAPTSAAGTEAFGAGGIGEDVDCIRATDIAPLLCEGLPGDAAWSSASVASDWGAPPLGVEPWQLQQCTLSMSYAAQGSSDESTTPASPPPPPS
jgi:hypothetical protein